MKWGGTILTVLLLVLWVGSAWWGVSLFAYPTGFLGAGCGRVWMGWGEPWSSMPYSIEWGPPKRHALPFDWWFESREIQLRSGRALRHVAIPIWVLSLLAAAPTFWLWRRDWWRGPGQCSKCGYDLRSNTSGVCPECGAAAPGELRAKQVKTNA